MLFQYILKPFTVFFTEFESVAPSVPSSANIQVTYSLFWKIHLTFWHDSSVKNTCRLLLIPFFGCFGCQIFKNTTFLCEYLRCRIVRKHCKKFIAKVGSEIISRTTFLHLDTKWEWPTRLAKKQGSGRKLRVQKWRQSVGRQKKAHFPNESRSVKVSNVQWCKASF